MWRSLTATALPALAAPLAPQRRGMLASPIRVAAGAGLLFPREDAFYVESFLKWFITLTEEVRVSVRQMSLEERPLSCALSAAVSCAALDGLDGSTGGCAAAVGMPFVHAALHRTSHAGNVTLCFARRCTSTADCIRADR